MKITKKISAILLVFVLMLAALAPVASADYILITPLIPNYKDATYLIGETPKDLYTGILPVNTSVKWQLWSNSEGWEDINGANTAYYTPPTDTVGKSYYRSATTPLLGTTVYSDSVTIGVAESPVLVMAPSTQSVMIDGSASMTVTTISTTGWNFTHSYWAWGPTSNPVDITGDFSSSGTFADTTYTPTMNTAGTINYFYVGEYTDTITGARDLVVYSNAAEVVVSYYNPFTDIAPPDWFYNDVLSANYMGLIDGMTATTFVPYGNLTIAQAVKLAACMNEYYLTGAVTLVNATVNWYDTYVDYAIANGIISSSDYAGRYNDYATRAEYVKIFYSALPSSEYTEIQTVPVGAIPDVSITDAYGYEVYTFYRAGILQGNDTIGTFAPDSNILRGEVATIIARMMDDGNRITVPYTWA